jgi:hypothetical protein
VLFKTYAFLRFENGEVRAMSHFSLRCGIVSWKPVRKEGLVLTRFLDGALG